MAVESMASVWIDNTKEIIRTETIMVLTIVLTIVFKYTLIIEYPEILAISIRQFILDHKQFTMM